MHKLMASPARNPLSDYRLLGLVGQGQFAQVYSAIDRRTGKLVAIKKNRHAADHADQEALILTQISYPNPTHPNLVSAQAIFSTPTGYQFILNYCESGTLRSHLNHTIPNPLPLPETKSLITDILHGLSHLHHQGITHNDLKPENILLTLTPSTSRPFPPLAAKITDFGHAQITHFPPLTPSQIGSPTYAAPERFSGYSSPASDLYAVGIMLYEMLLGDRPFSGNPDTLRQAHQTQPVPLPHTLTPDTRHLLATALHKQPHQRFTSADAMLSALHKLSAVHKTSSPIGLKTTVPSISVAQILVPLPPNHLSEPTEQRASISQPCLSALPERCSISKGIPYQLLDVLAIDNRHWLRIQTSLRSPKTYLEGFTRKGHFIGMLSLDLLLTQVSLTAKPYQLIALTQFTNIEFTNIEFTNIDMNANAHGSSHHSDNSSDNSSGNNSGNNSGNSSGNHVDSSVVLIQLKPFQLKHLRLPIQPTQVSALPWGYAVADDQQILLLDREAAPIARLQGLPSAIASPQKWQVTPLSTDPQHQTTLVLAQTTASNQKSRLFTLDLKMLDLDFIF